jgi:hypothetical protein
MDANTKKPRLTISQVVLGYKKPINRDDRDTIDIGNFLLLFNDSAFLTDLARTRQKLNITTKQVENDLQKPYIKLNGYRYQVNSIFLNQFKDKQLRKFEKVISDNILEPHHLSFNLFPVIEWYILYDFHIPAKHIPGPNPKMFELYMRHPFEFFRASHTASDIKHFVYQVKTKFQMYGKLSKNDKIIIDQFTTLLKQNKNQQKPLRNPKQRFMDKKIIAEWKHKHKETGQSLLQLLQEKADSADLPENLTGFAISDQELKKNTARIKRQKRRMNKPKL